VSEQYASFVTDDDCDIGNREAIDTIANCRKIW
jgi:hypothetical protein